MSETFGTVSEYVEKLPDPEQDYPRDLAGGVQEAVLAGGCFWCVEAVFRQLNGVLEVSSGYSGDGAKNANYNAVSAGLTNHAEAVHIRYDASQISFGMLLKVFFSVAHDPTQLNRQGPDVGRQYRSAIFYLDELQKDVAESYIRQLTKAGIFSDPIVTEVIPLEEFYQAEEYHQDYAMRNPAQPYILGNVPQKIAKLRKHFPEVLGKKPDAAGG